MSIGRKARFIQAAFGAVLLTLLMQPLPLMGLGAYAWLLFLPLLLFFALGASLKLIPTMIASFIAGQLWALLNGLVMTALAHALGTSAAGIVAPVVIIFAMLTIHEDFLANTIVGTVPAVFLGMAESFFLTSIQPNTQITPPHLTGLFLYGLVLAVGLVWGGSLGCRWLLGRSWRVNGGQ